MSSHHFLNPQVALARIHSFFYPFGNTPAQNLAAFAQPNHNVDLLLLGCGDVRHILCTANQRATLDATGTLTFVACDWEPGIIARNIFLLTLFQEIKEIESAWTIYYDFQVDAETLDIIRAHAARLLQISSLDDWQQSTYSHISFANHDTFNRVRAIWLRYPSYQVDHRPLAQSIRANKLGDRVQLCGVRNGGPFSQKSEPDSRKLFDVFWKTGRLDGGNAAHCHGNPLFLSEWFEGFNPHYGSNPTDAYQLSSAYLKGQGPVDLPSFVRKEFSTGARSFMQHAKRKTIKIIYAAAEAFDFCNLLSCGGGVPHWFQWGRLHPIQADVAMPSTFDCIHTSNLSDHIGMLNILLVTSPLLRQDSRGVIYTETLIETGRDSSDALSDQLCADKSTIGVLLGLWPISQVTPLVTSELAVTLEGMMSGGAGLNTIAWKNPCLGDPLVSGPPQIAIDASSIIHVLMTMYRQMLQRENLSAKFANLSDKKQDKKRNINRMTGSPRRATRHSLLLFISCISRRLSLSPQSLDDIVGNLLDAIQIDRQLILTSNGYQELVAIAHLLGMHSVETLKSKPQDVFIGPGAMYRFHPRTGLLAQPNLPPTVRIVLVVPRARLRVLEKHNGNPDLCGSIMLGSMAHNIFAALHLGFGRKVKSGSQHPKKMVCEDFDIEPEDDSGLGWAGTSDLIASFDCPTWTLFSSDVVEVSINVCSHEWAFMAELGPYLKIFAAPLENRECVSILVEESTRTPIPPIICHKQTTIALSTVPLTTEKLRISPVTLFFLPNSALSHLITRVDILDDGLKAQLVKAVVTYQQESPSTITILMDNRPYHRVEYPLPVNGDAVRLRLARKSSYIEVEVKPDLRPPTAHKTCSTHLFPVSPPDADGVMALWNVTRLSLDNIPAVSRKTAQKWIPSILGSMFSGREHALRDGHGDVIKDMKETIKYLFLFDMPLGLCTHDGGVHILIFTDHLRFDTLGETVVGDCNVCVLTDEIISSSAFPSFVQMMQGKDGKELSKLKRVLVTEAELKLWKALLPVAQERCRIGWKHGPGCEYRSKGVPVSLAFAQTPLCSCALGRVSSDFKQRYPTIAPFSVRVALSPVFSSWYIDQTVTVDALKAKAKLTTTTAATSGSTPQPVLPCAVCGKQGALRCSKCQVARYCSAVCQSKAWATHRLECNSLKSPK